MSEDIPQGWSRCDFGKIAKVENGFAFKSSDFTDDRKGNHAVIRMSNLKSGKVDLTDAKYVRPDVVNGLDRFKLSPNDFLFGMSGSLDNYGWISDQNESCYLNQRVGKLVSDHSDATFAAYMFLSEFVRGEIQKLAAGAAQLNISSKQVESIQILVPSVQEQKEIASVLTSVDKVIDQTEAQIRKFQDLKKGMMQELLTKGIGHTEFKDSPYGPIPVTWKLCELRELLDNITYGFTNPMPESDTGPYMITAKDIVGGEIVYEGARRTTKEAYDSLLTDKSKPLIGDILLTKDGTLGRLAVVDKPGICVNQSVAVLRAQESVPKKYVQYLLESPPYQRKMLDDAGGTTIKHIYITVVDKMVVAIPESRDEQDQIVSIVSGLNNRLSLGAKKLESIKRLKSSLMHDLLSGKVRVKVN